MILGVTQKYELRVSFKFKEPSHFSMLRSKLWYNKTETKNIKVAKMVEFILTSDQYPRKINFSQSFSSIILLLFLLGKTDFHKMLLGLKWVFCLGANDKNLGENVAWWHE